MKQKYVVIRVDGSIPVWPSFVLGGADPAAPAALREYALACERLDMASDYVRDVRALADRMDQWCEAHHEGKPDAPVERKANELANVILNYVMDRGGV